ncbi:MAG TPA: hypothetical protein VNU70_03330 [Puia sp.]|nr:hypothetical protein [Puia sp.]
MTRLFFLRSLASGLLGMALLVPAGFFLLTAVARVCFGTRGMYVYMAQQTQLMIGCLIVAVLFNVLALLRLRVVPGRIGPDVEISFRRSWINAAVVLQGTLFLLGLTIYLFIEYLRY